MFYSLTGTVVFTDETSVAIECGGVAFKCSASLNTLNKLPQPGKTATVFTHLNVREDALDLFGFADREELDCFKLLTGVTGVGPKAGLAILSQLTPGRLSLCVASGDAKAITAAQGVGPKLAQRIVLELKDKIKSALPALDNADLQAINLSGATGAGEEAVEALISLGYGRSESAMTVGRLDPSLSSEEMIKQALKMMMKAF